MISDSPKNKKKVKHMSLKYWRIKWNKNKKYENAKGKEIQNKNENIGTKKLFYKHLNYNISQCYNSYLIF